MTSLRSAFDIGSHFRKIEASRGCGQLDSAGIMDAWEKRLPTHGSSKAKSEKTADPIEPKKAR
jgi:hypothetical protein